MQESLNRSSYVDLSMCGDFCDGRMKNKTSQVDVETSGCNNDGRISGKGHVDGG